MSKTVLIDNGHGRETPGKKSPDGKLQEYAWAREIAKRVVNALCDKGVDARLLTPEDTDIRLGERVKRANAVCDKMGAGNVMLVSIHVNAAGDSKQWKTARGFLSFISPNAGGGSKHLARLLYEAAEQRGLKGNRWVTKEKYSVKSLAICRDTQCPAVLTENLFMDNKEDCAYLLTEKGKATIVEAHIEAILKYIES